MKLFGHTLINTVFYFGLIRLTSFFVAYTLGKINRLKVLREQKQLKTWVIWGFILYSVCTVALFFRIVSWKRGADEPGSK